MVKGQFNTDGWMNIGQPVVSEWSYLSHTSAFSKGVLLYRGVLAGPQGAAIAPSARAALFTPGVSSILKQLALGPLSNRPHLYELPVFQTA